MTAPAPPAGPAARVVRFHQLLLGRKWVRNARMEISRAGRIRSLAPESPDAACEQVSGWTVPGVPNVHSHSFQRALAGLAESAGPGSFWSWREVMYRLADRFSPADLGAVTRQLYVELLKAGFTCVGEFHYLHHAPGGGGYDDPAEMSRRIADAARWAGIGLVHMPVVYESAGFQGGQLVGAQRRFRLDLDGAAEMRAALPPGPGIRAGMALHSLRAVRAETVRRAARQSGAASLPVHIHAAEQEREVSECRVRLGARPVQWLLANAPVDERWCLVHATHVTNREVRGMARRGATVGLCPTTEANLGDGLFPLGEYAAQGGRYGVGTDSQISRSPVAELRLLDYGQRLAARSRLVPRTQPGSRVINPGERRGRQSAGMAGRFAGRTAALSAEEEAQGEAARSGCGIGAAAPGRSTRAPKATRDDDVSGRADRCGTEAVAGAGGTLLAHAWADGARALGWNGGSLAPGLRADLVVLDAEHPALTGREGGAVLDSWVFSGPETPVRHVMTGGRWVVRDGFHRHEEKAALQYRRAVRRLMDG